jgi:hypothetical protein
VAAANDFLATQAAFAKSLVGRCVGDPGADQTPLGQQALDAWTNSLGNAFEAWFSWLQLADVVTGSRWSPNPPGPPPSIVQIRDKVTVPADKIPANVDIVSSALDDGKGNQIDAQWITLAPQSLQASIETEVVIVVRAPGTTRPGTYSGAIQQATTNDEVVRYEIIFSP